MDPPKIAISDISENGRLKILKYLPPFSAGLSLHLETLEYIPGFSQAKLYVRQYVKTK